MRSPCSPPSRRRPPSFSTSTGCWRRSCRGREDAAVPQPTRRELERLAGLYGLVACVTGRPAAEARELVGVDGIRYAGEHGLELDPQAAEFAGRIGTFAEVVDWPDTERKPLSIAFHYRRADDREAARATLEQVARAATAEGLRARWGRLVLEVLPPVQATKGTRSAAVARRDGAAARALRRRRHDRPGRLRRAGRARHGGARRRRLRPRARRSWAPAPTSSSARPRRSSSCSAGSRDGSARVLRVPGDGRRRARCAPRRPAGAAAARASAADARDLRDVDEIGAMDAHEARRRQPLLELPQRRGAEERTVVGVDAGVVAVCLDVVHLVDVEQLGAAGGGDDRDPLVRARRSRCVRSRRRSSTRASRSGSTGLSR